MATKTKEVKKVNNNPIPADEVLEKVVELFEEYQSTTDAIMQDYFMQSGAILELGIADKNFIESVEKIEIKQPEEKDPDEDDDEEAFDRHCAANNICGVTLKTLDQQDKLRSFLETEIYPDYLDQQAFIHF